MSNTILGSSRVVEQGILPAQLQRLIAENAHIITGAEHDYDPLLDLVGDANFVLLGEASHGTHEFYHERARITQRLIVEKGFNAIAVEADWPDAYRINQYIRGQEPHLQVLADTNAREALEGFKRFPAWMWRNNETVKLVEWLRHHNDGLAIGSHKIGFYGLDLYSLFTSIEEILHYLDVFYSGEAQQARQRFACFDHFNRDSHYYAQVVGLNRSVSCENAVVDQLRSLYALADMHRKMADKKRLEAMFSAQQNARLVVHAEEYYRTMYQGHVSSWNMRDEHMIETLEAVSRHISQENHQSAKIVVWAHNSHVGDARATEAARHGEWNIGQLARELYGEKAILIGLTTYQGTVTASSDWDAYYERKVVNPALNGSVESLFHDTKIGDFMLSFKDNGPISTALSDLRLERAIGVIYRPHTERQSHYFYSSLPNQFDAILHFDQTHALEPLDKEQFGDAGEAPETFPVGV